MIIAPRSACDFIFSGPAAASTATLSAARLHSTHLSEVARQNRNRGEKTAVRKNAPSLPDGGRAGTGGRDFVYADSSKSARVK